MSNIQLFQNGKEIKHIIFPSTKRGEASTITLELKNISNNYLAFTGVKFEDKDCSAINLPIGLEPGAKMEFIVRFAPSVEREKPLNTSILFEMDVG